MDESYETVLWLGGMIILSLFVIGTAFAGLFLFNSMLKLDGDMDDSGD